MSASLEKISVLTLVLLITGAIDSVRNLPATALFGSSLIFFFLLSSFIFLIPVSLVSAELSSTLPEEEGGVYSWVKHALGKNFAFLTIWLQWINTMVWYPTVLSFIAGTLAYLINPALAHNKYYLITVILVTFWSLTLLGLTGLKASAKFAGFCAIVGILLPIGFIIILALFWLLSGKPLAISLHPDAFIPNWRDSHSWSSLTAIMTSFLGIELAAVHVKNIADPQRNFPKAIFFSVILILVTMIFGALAIAFVLPKEQINLVDGVLQAFYQFFKAYHLEALLPLMVVLLLLGSLGGMINWIISPAKGLFLAVENGFLPSYLSYKNKHGVASRVLILQALMVTLLCAGFFLFSSVNAIYWLFTDLSTELYILMYALMFVAALFLKEKCAHLPRFFTIPGGKLGYYIVCGLGLIGCAVTLIVGFIPPEESMQLGEGSHFSLIFAAGIVLMLAPALLVCLIKYLRSLKSPSIESNI